MLCRAIFCEKRCFSHTFVSGTDMPVCMVRVSDAIPDATNKCYRSEWELNFRSISENSLTALKSRPCGTVAEILLVAAAAAAAAAATASVLLSH